MFIIIGLIIIILSVIFTLKLYTLKIKEHLTTKDIELSYENIPKSIINGNMIAVTYKKDIKMNA